MSAPTLEPVIARRSEWRPTPADRRLFAEVYRWLALSTALTTATAALLERRAYLLHAIAAQPMWFIGIVSAVVVVPVVLKHHLVNLPAPFVFVAHVGFAVLLGLTMALVFDQYTGAAAAPCFGAVSITFALVATLESYGVARISSAGELLRTGACGLLVSAALEALRSRRIHRPPVEWLLVALVALAYAVVAAHGRDRIERARAQAPQAQPFPYGLQCATAIAMDFVNLFVVLPRLLRRLWKQSRSRPIAP